MEKIKISQIVQELGDEEARQYTYVDFDKYEIVHEKTGGEFDLSKFPNLRVYEGFYEDSSGKFRTLSETPMKSLQRYCFANQGSIYSQIVR